MALGHPNAGTIDLAEATDYTAVTAAVRTVAEKFPELGGGKWTFSAGKDHPADITTLRRLPNDAELATWSRLNADQSIPHFDALTLNGPVTGPVWLSESTPE